MKKQFLAYFFAAMTLGGIFTSCSSDDDPIVNPVPETTTFNEKNGLKVIFNGEALAGKEVIYTPSSEDATKAVLELKGADFDLLQHMTKEANGLTLNTPGIIPGSANLKLDLDLTIEGDKCFFNGLSETEHYTFDYKGEISKSNLNIEIANAKLKNTDLVGQWNMVPFETDEWKTEILSTPLFLKWDSDSLLNMELAPGFVMPMPIETIVNLATSAIELIDNGQTKVSALTYLTDIFKNVRLAEDGNITAELKDVANGKNELEVSPKNVAFYVVDKTPTATDRGQLRLFLNLESIDKLSKQNSRAAREGFDLGSVLSFINPMIQNGIPLTLVPTEDGKMAIILDSKILIPIIKDMLAPVLADPALIETLSEMIKNTPGMEDFAPMAGAMLKALPNALKGSKTIEIGLKFEQAK